MRIAGVGIIIAGWLVAMSSLFLTQLNGVRIVLICVGIAVSLFGNLGVVNKYYLDRAIWKK
jgi:hypothetical protein